MTLNARFILKCALRFTDDTLDVRTLWLSDSTTRIGVARGGGGEWAGGPSPPPCGQLTRCFSAVAELLVFMRHTAIFTVCPLCVQG